jgi:hypothetical protein
VNPPRTRTLHHLEAHERLESPRQSNVSIVGEGSQEGFRGPVGFFREGPVIGFHIGMTEAVVGFEHVAKRGLPAAR